MKKDIHPTYHPQATISCACGATYKVGSTEESTSIELCSQCHPFYTGKQKIVDTARRVEKFEARTEKKTGALTHKEKMAKKKERAEKRAAKKAEAENA